jgi:N-acetylneuraminate synthase
VGNNHVVAELPLGQGGSPLIIAEVAQAHDGSLGLAHAFIDAAANAGANAIKFQTHLASAESTLDEPFRVRFSLQDQTRLNYWQRMEFTRSQWQGLADHARARGLFFLSSAFSIAAIELLKEVGVAAWKLGSGEFASQDLWKAMVTTRKPILFSTGLATRAEIKSAVDTFCAKNVPFALLQCTTSYPSPLEEVGLNVIDELRNEFGCPVGLSDHSGLVFPGLAALARGADILEVHITFHRGMFGPDVIASLTFEELGLLCQMRDALVTMDSHPVDKDKMAERLQELRKCFSRSLAPVRALSAGSILRPEMLTPKKPAGGIPPSAVQEIVGRRLARDVTPDRILHWSDLLEEGK